MTDDDSIESLPFDDNDEIFDNNDDNGVAEMFKYANVSLSIKSPQYNVFVL